MTTPYPTIMLPYRDTNNTTISYAPAPAPLPNHTSSTHPTNPYDSDAEPLISQAAPSNIETLDEDSLQRFTATGRPMPEFQFNALQSMGGDMFSLPQLLPRRYTDDSIIPAIVVGVIPRQKPEAVDEVQGREGNGGRRKSLLGKLKAVGKAGMYGGMGGSNGEGKDRKGITKVVYMPRREYLKYFARGLKGEYIGSEPERRWTEEELEEKFGEFKPVTEKKKGSRAPC